ncbi:MAG: HAD family phosphatase [Bacteroidales bacterium]|nr:HAD family phosphatase [Bacteroidales bacterium]
MTYKAIVLDLDGTLTNDEKIITPRTYRALMEAQQRGVIVVLASGRPPHGIRYLADELHLNEGNGYILAFNGGQIIRCSDGHQMYSQELSSDFVPELYEAAVSNGFEILTYQTETIESTSQSNPYIQKASQTNRMPIVWCPDFVNDIHYPIYKCLIVGDPERMEAFETKLAKQMEGRMNICCSTPFFLECAPLGIDKANALRQLFGMLDIPLESVIAFGDGHNDISMIRLAGLGVAMDNADESVKQSADLVTASNNDDGVALVIEKLILESPAGSNGN